MVAPAKSPRSSYLGWYEEYHPYGSTAWWASNAAITVSRKRYRYTGMERDEETGLQCHGVRYYAGWLGRWTSADPIELGDGGNAFAYCRGLPVTGVDTQGHETSTVLSPSLLYGTDQPLPDKLTLGPPLANAFREVSVTMAVDPAGEPAKPKPAFDTLSPDDAKAARTEWRAYSATLTTRDPSRTARGETRATLFGPNNSAASGGFHRGPMTIYTAPYVGKPADFSRGAARSEIAMGDLHDHFKNPTALEARDSTPGATTQDRLRFSAADLSGWTGGWGVFGLTATGLDEFRVVVVQFNPAQNGNTLRMQMSQSRVDFGMFSNLSNEQMSQYLRLVYGGDAGLYQGAGIQGTKSEAPLSATRITNGSGLSPVQATTAAWMGDVLYGRTNESLSQYVKAHSQ